MRGKVGFSTVLRGKYLYKQRVMSLINFCPHRFPELTTPFFGRGRDYAIYVSRLLKVVETQIWAQNDRNIQVYISTYNKPKL